MKEIFPDYYSVLLYGPPGVGKSEYIFDLVEYYLKHNMKIKHLFLLTVTHGLLVKKRKDSQLIIQQI